MSVENLPHNPGVLLQPPGDSPLAVFPGSLQPRGPSAPAPTPRAPRRGGAAEEGRVSRRRAGGGAVGGRAAATRGLTCPGAGSHDVTSP